MATLVIKPARGGADLGGVLTPMEQRVELERQEYDARHLMRLDREGKSFKHYLDDTDGLDIVGMARFSPRGLLMFQYLDQARKEAKAAIAKRLESLPIRQALDNDDVNYLWGVYEDRLSCIVDDWHRHAQECRRAGEPVPTPAYWLSKNRPPSPFNGAEGVLAALKSILPSFIVDGHPWAFTDNGLKEFQPKRAVYTRAA